MTRDEAQIRRVVRQMLTRGGARVNVAVTATATTKAITISPPEPDAVYGVVVTPNWLTTVRVTAKATGGFTVDFGTAAPVGAAIDYLVFRQG